MKKKCGDIIEFQTSKGFVYGQYTFEMPGNRGSVIRILNGFYIKRPGIEELNNNSLRFTILLPLGSALHRKLITKIGNFPIKPEWQGLPVFRLRLAKDIGNPNPKSWALWHGKSLGIIEENVDVLKNIPIMQIVNMKFLVDRLESDNVDELYSP